MSKWWDQIEFLRTNIMLTCWGSS